MLVHSNGQYYDYENEPTENAAEVDQTGHSDSNSDVTEASESVANNMANLYMLGENKNAKFENNAFIDFLGVGATWGIHCMYSKFHKWKEITAVKNLERVVVGVGGAGEEDSENPWGI